MDKDIYVARKSIETCDYKLNEVPDWLVYMPKTNLHCHLGGSIRISTMLELADKYGVILPANNEKDLKELLVCKNKENKSLQKYLDNITICESVFRKPEAFQRVAYEICEDAHKENIRLLELRFGPTRYANDAMNLHEIVESTLDGLKSASRDFNMHTGLIICGIRTDKEATKKAVELAVEYRDKGIVGFDLAGKENGFRPRQFSEIVEPVKDNLLPITIHAGEDDTCQSIKEAINDLNARRIGHGITLYESKELMEYVDKVRIGIEFCVTSNIDTGVVKSYEEHPLKEYLKKGIRCSINTDNSTISDTTVTNEYMLLMDKLSMTQKDIFKLGRHAIKSAFISSSETNKRVREFDEYRRQFIDDKTFFN